MDFIKYFTLFCALLPLTYGVKVNLQGSLSFGKEVLDSLTHYIRRNMASRRSEPVSKDDDVIYLITKSSSLCQELTFCNGKLEIFLNEYITVLTKSVEATFQSILRKDAQVQELDTAKHLFEAELKNILHKIKRLLRRASIKVTEKSEAYIWIEVIKMISAMFQEAAIVFATDRLDEKTDDIVRIQKKLMQKFVIATVVVESKYEIKLCADHNICTKTFECTKALNTLLGSLKDMDGEKAKIFMRYVSEGLLDTNFYSHVSETTANEFQVILNDMGYSDNVPTKEILSSVHKAVEGRFDAINTKTHFSSGKDVALMHVILSDMDHIYDSQKLDPFHNFLSNFFDWFKLGTPLKKPVKELLYNIGNQIVNVPEELQVKLIHEVRAFLELTVDPVK